MLQRIESIREEIKKLNPVNQDDVEKIRIFLLGKKGLITLLFEDFRNVSKEEKKNLGQVINTLKNEAQEKIDNWKQTLGRSSKEKLILT
jgi:phenylalanyl-tRNA synthetase alpha chain